MSFSDKALVVHLTLGTCVSCGARGVDVAAAAAAGIAVVCAQQGGPRFQKGCSFQLPNSPRTLISDAAEPLSLANQKTVLASGKRQRMGVYKRLSFSLGRGTRNANAEERKF